MIIIYPFSYNYSICILRWNSLGKNTEVGCHSLFQEIFWPRDWTWVFCIAGRWFTNWTMREAPLIICEVKGKSSVLLVKKWQDVDCKLPAVGVVEWHARFPLWLGWLGGTAWLTKSCLGLPLRNTILLTFWKDYVSLLHCPHTIGSYTYQNRLSGQLIQWGNHYSLII